MPHHTTPHHRFVSYVLEWITHESTFIFWLIILNLTSSRVAFLSYWGYWNVFFQEMLSFMRDVAVVFFSSVTVDIVIYSLLKKFPAALRSVKIFIITVSALMFSLDIFTIWHYKTAFNMPMLDIALMTNFREGSEFLSGYLLDVRFMAFAACVFLALFVLRKIYSLFQRQKIFLAVILILGSLAGASMFLRNYILKSLIYVPNPFAPLRIYRMVSELYASHAAYEEMLNGIPAEVIISSKGRDIPNIVFILGEATTRNHMQLYGYELPTTPKLSARKDIHIFTDTVSPHAATSPVLKKIFTFCRYDSPNEWFTYTSLLRIMKEAGYFTLWLSAQEKSIGGDSVNMYSGQCDSANFIKPARDDGALLPFLDEEMRNEHEKNFYVLHLGGCHYRYSRRYPPEYSKFSADDEGGFSGISRLQKKTRAEYDNAVLYNDFIVDEIIRRFENENAIVIYVPDHGEEVCDTSSRFGHYDGTINRSLIEIPFIIWTSPKFRKAYPGLESQIASSVDRPYMTDDMIHTVLDIMGIETPEYDPSKSIINPKFDSSRKRIYAGMQYDKDTGLHEIQ